MQWIQQWDEAVVLWIRQYLYSPALDVIMKAVSFLGDHGMIWIGAAILLLIMEKGRKKNWAGVLAASLAVSALITNIFLKPCVARLRPYDKLCLDIMVPALQDFSFPSGHTTAAFAGAVVIWHWNPKWGKAALLFSVVMAFSRIYLSLHYPTDVIAGAVVGSFSAWLVLYIGLKTKCISK